MPHAVDEPGQEAVGSCRLGNTTPRRLGQRRSSGSSPMTDAHVGKLAMAYARALHKQHLSISSPSDRDFDPQGS